MPWYNMVYQRMEPYPMHYDQNGTFGNATQ